MPAITLFLSLATEAMETPFVDFAVSHDIAIFCVVVVAVVVVVLVVAGSVIPTINIFTSSYFIYPLKSKTDKRSKRCTVFPDSEIQHGFVDG